MEDCTTQYGRSNLRAGETEDIRQGRQKMGRRVGQRRRLCQKRSCWCDDLRRTSPSTVRSPCGLSVEQANEGSGGGTSGTGAPQRAMAHDDLSRYELWPVTIFPAFPISASPSSSKRKRLPSGRAGRYGVTVLHWEEDSWIDRTTVAIAM